MSILNGNFWFNGGSGDAGDPIAQSLRFRESSTPNLSLTGLNSPSTYTVSFWFKRGDLEKAQQFIWWWDPSGMGQGFAPFANLDSVWNNGTLGAVSTGLCRDPAAWYHLVVNTGTDNWWLNGELIAGDRSGGMGTVQAGQTGFNIGGGGYSQYSFDGYLAEFYLVDGQTLGPTTFGRYNSQGVWVPVDPGKDGDSSWFGTDGFHLTFDPGQTNGIGHDSSGQGNHFTATGFDTTSGDSTYDCMQDSPTDNFATANPLVGYNILSNYGTTIYLSDANLLGENSNYVGFVPTTGYLNSGKWAFQATSTVNTTSYVGIVAEGSDWQVCPRPDFPGWSVVLDTSFYSNASYYLYKNTQESGQGSGTQTYYGSTSIGANVPIVVVLDVDNTQVRWDINGVTGAWVDYSQYLPADTPVGFYVSLRGGTELDYGQQNLTPPTGYEKLSTAELPASTIPNGRDNFRAITDAGADILTSAQNTFADGLWWVKDLVNTNQHQLVDSVRGATNAFNLPTLAGDTTYTAPSGNSVAWCWKAGSSTVSNTNGTITTQVTANVDAGFSIITYTGNQTSGQSVGHGLSQAPEFVFSTTRSSTSSIMPVYHAYLDASNPEDYYIQLDSSATRVSDSTYWEQQPTNQVVYVGSAVNNNGSEPIVMYAWNSVPGYSAFGSYQGNNDNNGVFVYTGFRPAFVLIKAADTTGSWVLFDTARDPVNPVQLNIFADSTAAESSSTNTNIDILSNGFKLRGTAYSAQYYNYIYAAFAENPFEAPVTAR